MSVADDGTVRVNGQKVEEIGAGGNRKAYQLPDGNVLKLDVTTRLGSDVVGTIRELSAVIGMREASRYLVPIYGFGLADNGRAFVVEKQLKPYRPTEELTLEDLEGMLGKIENGSATLEEILQRLAKNDLFKDDFDRLVEIMKFALRVGSYDSTSISPEVPAQYGRNKVTGILYLLDLGLFNAELAGLDMELFDVSEGVFSIFRELRRRLSETSMSDTGGGDRSEMDTLTIHPDQVQFPQPLIYVAERLSDTPEDLRESPVQPIMEDTISGIGITPLESAAKAFLDKEAQGCGGAAYGGGSLLGGAFTLPVLSLSEGSLVEGLGAGEGHENSNDGKKHNGYDGQEIYNSKIHSAPFVFRAKNKDVVQQSSVATTPHGTTIQYGLSTLETNGERTSTPNNTWPALSNILERRSNWPAVNTGSFQMYNTPNDSIGANDTTIPTNPSIGLVRRAYAADPSAGSGQAGGCSPLGTFLTRTAPGRWLHTFIWREPNRFITQWFLGDNRRPSQLPSGEGIGGKVMPEDCEYVFGHPALRETYPLFDEHYRECKGEENKPDQSTSVMFIPATGIWDNGLTKKCVKTAKTPTVTASSGQPFMDTFQCPSNSSVFGDVAWKIGLQSEQSYDSTCLGWPAINVPNSPATFKWEKNTSGQLVAQMHLDFLTNKHPCGAGYFTWYTLMKEKPPKAASYPKPTELLSHHDISFTITKGEGGGEIRVVAGLNGFMYETIGGALVPFLIKVGLYVDQRWGDQYPSDPVIATCSPNTQSGCDAQTVFIDGAYFGYRVNPGKTTSIDIDWSTVYKYLVTNGYIPKPVAYTDQYLSTGSVSLGMEVRNATKTDALMVDLSQSNFTIGIKK